MDQIPAKVLLEITFFEQEDIQMLGFFTEIDENKKDR